MTQLMSAILFVSCRWGDHYWMTDFEMDCDQTESGWFELKMIASSYTPNGGWEGK